MLFDTSSSVVIAEDHAMVRSGLCLLVGEEPDLTVVGQTATVVGARELVERHRPDVLVLDLNLADGSSLPHIADFAARTKVVVLTMDASAPKAREALRSGAGAYVLKDAADDELKAAMRAVLREDTYVSPAVRQPLTAPTDPDAGDDLTGREREVLRLIGLGHTNLEIAQLLFISARTVESHRAHIQRKLGAASRAELVRCALDRGLLDVERAVQPV